MHGGLVQEYTGVTLLTAPYPPIHPLWMLEARKTWLVLAGARSGWWGGPF
jgi:hypothetical protein